MFPMIARGYLTDLKNMRTAERPAFGYFWVVYCLIVLPLMLGYFEAPRKAVIYLAAAIPFAYGILQMGLCPLRIPEMMFLCPLDAPMRMQYIRSTCLFRVGLHTAAGAAGAMVTLAAGNDVPGAVGLTVNIFLTSVIGLCVQGARDTIGRTTVRGIGAGLGVSLQLIYVSAAVSGGFLGQKRWEQAVIAVMQALFLLAAGRYAGYLGAMLREAVSYETAEKRVKKQRSV